MRHYAKFRADVKLLPRCHHFLIFMLCHLTVLAKALYFQVVHLLHSSSGVRTDLVTTMSLERLELF